MRTRSRRRNAGRRLAAVGGAPDLAHTILTMTDGGFGTPLVTTAAPHGLTLDDVGLSVVISGNSVPSYNTTDTIVDVPGVDQFMLQTTAYTADGTGGTWRPA